MNGSKLKYGMVGGGIGAFIGEVHRKGAEFDGLSELAAGAFSRDYENTRKTCQALNIDERRGYKTFEEMAEKESQREDGIDYVIIVTPNDLHYSVAKNFLEKNINVVCDKPLTLTVEEAKELQKLARDGDLLFCVTYANQGYPMVKQARQMVRDGRIGKLRMVMGEYPQSWLAGNFEKTGSKILWRLDPKHSGVSNCVADIGSHLENLVSYITGTSIEKLCAQLDIFGEGRILDTNGKILVKYRNGASGMYWCSQIAIGSENALQVRLIGTEGSIQWNQENPNYLLFTPLGGPTQILSKGNGYLDEKGLQYNRIPPGHPDGTFEAFANVYKAFCTTLLNTKKGQKVPIDKKEFPDIDEGVKGMEFIYACVNSSKSGAVWVEI
jgi:predicted dehydrogenase